MAKTGEDACCRSKCPGNESLVSFSQEGLLIATVCFLFPLRSQFLFLFSKHQESTLGEGNGTSEEDRRAERGKGGQGWWGQVKSHSEDGDKSQMRKESRSEDAQRMTSWGEKKSDNQICLYVEFYQTVYPWGHVLCAIISSQRHFTSWIQG